MARIDKFIWAVRLFKTRSLAANQCKTNKILVNNESVKPSKEVKIGDTVSVKKNGAIFSYKILALLDKRVGAKLVADFILETTPIEEIAPVAQVRTPQVRKISGGGDYIDSTDLDYPTFLRRQMD